MAKPGAGQAPAGRGKPANKPGSKPVSKPAGKGRSR